MKKRIVLLTLGLLVLVSLLVSSSGCKAPTPTAPPVATPSLTPTPTSTAPPAQKITLNYLTFLGPTGLMTERGIIPFIDGVAKRSNGRLEIKPFWGDTLFKIPDYFNAVSQGKVELANLGCIYAAGIIPGWAASVAPFLFDDTEHWIRAWKGEIYQMWAADAAKYNIAFLGDGALYWGMNHLDGNKRIYVPSDMKGVKIRTFSALQDAMVQAAGGAPVSMAMGEVYVALQRGTVDSAFHSLSGIDTTKVYEVMKFINKIPVAVGSPQPNVINKDALARLPEDLRKILIDVSQEVSWNYTLTEIPRVEDELTVTFKKMGLEVHEPTPQELELWKQAAKPAWDKFVQLAGEAGSRQIDIANKTRKAR